MRRMSESSCDEATYTAGNTVKCDYVRLRYGRQSPSVECGRAGVGGGRGAAPLTPRPHASPEGLQRPSWATEYHINNLGHKYCQERRAAGGCVLRTTRLS